MSLKKRKRNPLPRLGDVDLKVAKYILEYNRTYGHAPSPKMIGDKFDFTRQAGYYYLCRMIEFKVLYKKRSKSFYSVYHVSQELNPPFDKLLDKKSPLPIA